MTSIKFRVELVNKFLFFVLFVFFLGNVKAQEIKTNESGSWYTLVNKVKFSENLYALNATQWRLVDFAKNTRIFLLMPSLSYKFNKKISAGVGYVYVNFSQEGIREPSLDYEHRVFQHVTLYNTIGKVKTNQRFIFEERFKTKLDGAKVYSNRFRFRFNFDFNLLKLKGNNYIVGRVSEELRIRFSSGVSDPKFDQNNFAALVGYTLLPNSKVYIGYGRDYYNGADYWGDHLLHVALTYNIDLSKKIN